LPLTPLKAATTCQVNPLDQITVWRFAAFLSFYDHQ
jgi:hypothetical protein